ncbi:hypothetical protein SUGI_0365630 [Cryptomeria japonica]|nr:hypothetical protein SUGI_0365630 [Cryptomeria japonica]
MRRDRQYFLQMMAQSGAKIPHDFDMSQIMEHRPLQQPHSNMNQRRPNSGGNRGPHMVPESPSALLQKPEVPHTHGQTYDTYLHRPLWKSYVDKYAQSHTNAKDQPPKQLDVQRHAQNLDTRKPHVKFGGNTMEHDMPVEYGIHAQNRYGVPQHESIPSCPYTQRHYRPPPYEHVYDQYHPYMQHAPPPIGASSMGYGPRSRSPPKSNLEQQIRDLQKKMEDINTPKPTYTMRDICPYPFDKSIPMPPFPTHFVMPKFDKYRGKGDPKAHIRQFFTACIEVAAEDTYLMRLFPQSLGDQAMEWFSQLPPGIKSWGDLAKAFIQHFFYNIETNISVTTLCNTKQKEGESFASFLQRCRNLASRCSCEIPQKQMVEMFTQNVNKDIGYDLRKACLSTFKDVIEKGLATERVLIEQGLIKIFKENKDDFKGKDKPRFWNKNKNTANDGVVDANTVRLKVIFSGSSSTNNQVNTQTTSRSRRKYTPLGEPLESVFKKLVANKVITIPDFPPYEPKVKPNWWNDDEYCEFHKSKGHKIGNCHRLKNIIQDLIDRGDIEIEGHSSNQEHEMFKEPFPKHDKGKAKATDDQTNYIRASYNYDSTINHISMDNYVSTIIIKDKASENSTQRPKIVLKGVGSSSEPTSECHVTTRRGKITLQGAPTKITASSSTKPEYDLVEQLGMTPTLISILELLRISPAHKAILDKILRDTVVPTDLNVDQFQAMVGYLSIPHSLTFTEADDASVSQPHNAPLHIEAFIHKHRIK